MRIIVTAEPGSYEAPYRVRATYMETELTTDVESTYNKDEHKRIATGLAQFIMGDDDLLVEFVRDRSIAGYYRTMWDVSYAPQEGHSNCMVCGSSAVKGKTVCPHHLYVCRKHLVDPCPECDSGSVEDGWHEAGMES